VHPALIGPDDIDILDGQRGGQSLRELYGYDVGWGVPGERIRAQITDIMCRSEAATDNDPVPVA
jgi:hypothetical protein